MLISMWGTGELRREYKVYDSKVYMRITRPLEPGAIPVCILLNNAHVYYPLNADEFLKYLPVYRVLAVEHLCLPEDMGSIRRFIDYVQDGFDELFSKFPAEDDRDSQVYGEVDVHHGDVKFTKVLSK